MSRRPYQASYCISRNHIQIRSFRILIFLNLVTKGFINAVYIALYKHFDMKIEIWRIDEYDKFAVAVLIFIL